MRIKPGVTLVGLQPPMRRALMAADTAYKNIGRSEGVTITSGLEGTHSAGSLHYYGYAIDCRIRDPGGAWALTQPEVNKVAKDIQEDLGLGYDVIIESTHIHIEYDQILEVWDSLY